MACNILQQPELSTITSNILLCALKILYWKIFGERPLPLLRGAVVYDILQLLSYHILKINHQQHNKPLCIYKYKLEVKRIIWFWSPRARLFLRARRIFVLIFLFHFFLSLAMGSKATVCNGKIMYLIVVTLFVLYDKKWRQFPR